MIIGFLIGLWVVTIIGFVILGLIGTFNTQAIKDHTRAIRSHTQTVQIHGDRLEDHRKRLDSQRALWLGLKGELAELERLICTCIPGDNPNQLVHDDQCPMHEI